MNKKFSSLTLLLKELTDSKLEQLTLLISRNFWKRINFNIQNEVAIFFVQRYDIDDDGQLNYTEFLQAVLTRDNAVLRTVTAQRPNYDVQSDEYLPDEIEYALSKLIDK